MSLEAAQDRHKNAGRNDTCPCGSEKKYKKCHQSEDDSLIAEHLKSQVDAAEKAAAAEAEAAEAEAKASGKKVGVKGKPGAPQVKSRSGPSQAASGGRSGGGNKAGLPRRGAV